MARREHRIKGSMHIPFKLLLDLQEALQSRSCLNQNTTRPQPLVGRMKHETAREMFCEKACTTVATNWHDFREPKQNTASGKRHTRKLNQPCRPPAGSAEATFDTSCPLAHSTRKRECPQPPASTARKKAGTLFNPVARCAKNRTTPPPT
jgi:hypothetical protein